MSIIIKRPDEIEKMRFAGKLAADVLEMITPYVKPGATTGEINQICHDYIVNVQKAIPAPLNYHGYPASVCTSVNEVVCHGIPSFNHFLIDGDILNIDVTVIKDGYHADTNMTFYIGEVADEVRKLVEVTKECLYKSIKIVKPGIRFGDIGNVIQKHAEGNGYSVVREFCGHGIGRNFHEDPEVLHYGKKNTGKLLKEGMTFTIEPMINLGSHHINISKEDGWTVTTKDRKPSAQFEHTLVVTKTGCEVITLRTGEII